MAFNQHDNSKCIQDTTDINATATDDGNSTPSPDGVKPKTSDTLAVPASSYDNGNCEDENQTECSNLNRELVNKIEVSEEEIRRTNSDGGIRISLDNQNVEGSGTVCQGRRSSMADTQDIKNHAITPGISSKPDRLAHGTYRSAEDEMESNTDEALNTCRTANGYESAPLNLIVKQESTYHHKNAEETGSSNIDSTNNARTDMNECRRPDGNMTESMDTDHHPLSDSWDTSSSVDDINTLFERISEENRELRKTVVHQATFANKLQEENASNVAQITRSIAHIQHLQRELETKSKRLESCESENNRIQREKAGIKETMKQLNDELNKQKQENSDQRNSMREISQKFEDQKRQTDEFKQHAAAINSSWKTFYTEEYNKWMQIQASMNAELERRVAEIQNTKEEHVNLLLRYSKLAGESLSMGNVNVTDLSDPNRPTKLAEQFSELYDNDWTDAFEELTHFGEEERIDLLIKILQRAYELSMEMATPDWLTRCYYTTYEDYIRVHTGTDTCDMGQSNIEESTEMETNGMAETESTRYASDPHHGEELTEIGTKDRTETESKTTSDDATIVAHFSEAVQHKKLNVLEMPDQKFDFNEREQGAVKMFAHVKKKILSSHSQRIQMVIRNCLMKEFKVLGKHDGEATKLFDYAAKCCELCLLMCVKDPPLYINFQTDATNYENVSFNNEQYKAYTKKGKHIQFLVWPCLFLEKNGAILAKGIAQGGDEH